MAGEGVEFDFPIMGIQVIQLFVGRRAIIALGYERESHRTLRKSEGLTLPSIIGLYLQAVSGDL
jgi:hypothetical protein